MVAMPIWRKLERQTARLPFSFAELSAGSNNAASIAITAMTTSNSISVKA